MSMGRFGRYLVLARWAGGGMADIYVARQRGAEGFDKLVALKLMRPDVAEEAEFREMFFSEARTSALLSHPGIVQTFDAGEIQGRIYMVMELVNGEPLNRLLRVIRDTGPLTVPLAVQIVREVAIVLDYAHTLRDLQGRPLELVHRDVSPSNIMLSHEGNVKLLDFGVAKVANRAQSTRAGVLKGKTSYMARSMTTTTPRRRTWTPSSRRAPRAFRARSSFPSGLTSSPAARSASSMIPCCS